MAFCKTCGSVYAKKDGCPVCASKETEQNADCENGECDTTQDHDANMRRRSWIQLLIGVPLFIGAIYLISALTAGLQ